MFIPCRLALLSLAAANLCYTWAALRLLKTPEAKPSCLLHQLIEHLATECPQQDTQRFRWLPTQRLLKVLKCELKKKSKTWQWLRKALHLLAWSQTQLSALMMMMRKTVTPLPPQLPALFPPQRSSEKRTAVCVCVCISVYPQPEYNGIPFIYFSLFLFTVEALTLPIKEELLDLHLNIKNSSLLDASHAVSIQMHQTPDLSNIIGK